MRKSGIRVFGLRVPPFIDILWAKILQTTQRPAKELEDAFHHILALGYPTDEKYDMHLPQYRARLNAYRNICVMQPVKTTLLLRYQNFPTCSTGKATLDYFPKHFFLSIDRRFVWTQSGRF